MNLCSCKPLMGTGSEKLFNTQTANYGVDFVNWVGPNLERERDKVGRFMEQQHTYTNLVLVSFNCVYKNRHERSVTEDLTTYCSTEEMTLLVVTFCKNDKIWQCVILSHIKQPCKNSQTISFVAKGGGGKHPDHQSSLVLYGNNCGWMFGSHGSHITGRSWERQQAQHCVRSHHTRSPTHFWCFPPQLLSFQPQKLLLSLSGKHTHTGHCNPFPALQNYFNKQRNHEADTFLDHKTPNVGFWILLFYWSALSDQMCTS